MKRSSAVLMAIILLLLIGVAGWCQQRPFSARAIGFVPYHIATTDQMRWFCEAFLRHYASISETEIYDVQSMVIKSDASTVGNLIKRDGYTAQPSELYLLSSSYISGNQIVLKFAWLWGWEGVAVEVTVWGKAK